MLSTHAAPKAYAYLVIVDGEGTLSVVLTRDFKRARAYLNRSIALFRKAKQFNMDDIKMTSGFGGLASAFWQPASRANARMSISGRPDRSTAAFFWASA